MHLKYWDSLIKYHNSLLLLFFQTNAQRIYIYEVSILLVLYLWEIKRKNLAFTSSLLFWDARKMERILILWLSKYLFYDAFRRSRDKNKLKLSAFMWYEFVLEQDIKNFLATKLQNFLTLLSFLLTFYLLWTWLKLYCKYQ